LSDKLVERLRERCENGDYEYWYKKAPGDMEAAADRIEALEQALREAAKIARNGCLVPPDGGTPTEAERLMCDHIAAAIDALLTPSAAPERQ
jgi:hypothetical protein